MHNKIIFLTLLLTTALQAIAKDNYNITLNNTGTSTIYVTSNPDIADEVEVQELEKVGSVALAPRESDVIEEGKSFAVYTRLPKSNYKYERNFTLAFTEEPEADEQLNITLADLENNNTDGMPIIIINHLNEPSSPEAFYALCPNGSRAQKHKNSDMYFCTLNSYDAQHNEYIETNVPVIHYVYKNLPSWVWSRWYTKNPVLYHLYDRDSQYQAKLTNYQAAWSTPWYTQWYKKQPATATEHLKSPA